MHDEAHQATQHVSRRTRRDPDIRKAILMAIILTQLAGAGAIFAIGRAHASHPEIHIIDLH
jgi:hypothetical protein